MKYIGEVDYITGADLFLFNNTDAHFDENFFMYSEESDLQFKLAKKNKKRLIIDGPMIIHLEGGSQKEKNNFLAEFKRFGRIQQGLSRIRFIKNNRSIYKSYILKILLTFLWMHPFLIKHTGKYIPKIWSI